MKTIAYVLLAVLFVSALPYAAEAASIRIKPHQFKPCKPSDTNNWTEPSFIRGDGGEAEYYAVANLPVGKRITQVTLFHRGDGTSRSDCKLRRVRIAEKYEDLYQVDAQLNTGGIVMPFYSGGGSGFTVAAGYTYYVWVEVGSTNAVHGVKIKYE